MTAYLGHQLRSFAHWSLVTWVLSHLRMDKGTDTGVMATMHAFLQRHHGAHMSNTPHLSQMEISEVRSCQMDRWRKRRNISKSNQRTN